jgi:hypothetical protein
MIVEQWHIQIIVVILISPQRTGGRIIR